MKKFTIEHIHETPAGYRVKSITKGKHVIRIAFPAGRYQAGSGKVVEVLHPRAENPICRISRIIRTNVRAKNPGELIILGANPMGKRRNPDAAVAADELNAEFHARPTEKVITATEPHIPAGDYAQCGMVRLISFKPRGGGQVRDIWFDTNKPRLLANAIGKHLYLAGGDQNLDSTLRKWGESPFGVIPLGEARSIEYWTEKFHTQLDAKLRGKPVEWVHEFGEEDGQRPDLYYNAGIKRLFFRGGNYRIEAQGIVN
jgi:hypothetical protein